MKAFHAMEVFVRTLLCLALAAVPACGNVNHPEYHPVTSVQYTQAVSYPASGPSIGGGQPVNVVAPPVPWLAPPAPIGIPAPRPMDPPDMGW